MSEISLACWTKIPSRTFVESIATLNATPKWLQRRRELLEIRSYRDDWDGFGAHAPDHLLVDAAIKFLHLLEGRGETPPMRITLSPDGLIAMEWQHGGHFRQVQILSDNEAEWMDVQPDGQSEFSSESFNTSRNRQIREDDCPTTQQTQRRVAVGDVVPSFAF